MAIKKRSITEQLLTPRVPYIYGMNLDKLHMCYEDCDHFQSEHNEQEEIRHKHKEG